MQDLITFIFGNCICEITVYLPSLIASPDAWSFSTNSRQIGPGIAVKSCVVFSLMLWTFVFHSVCFFRNLCRWDALLFLCINLYIFIYTGCSKKYFPRLKSSKKQPLLRFKRCERQSLALRRTWIHIIL